MKEISVAEYAKMVAQNNKGTKIDELKRQLADSLLTKRNGAKCMSCGATIWAAGSAIVSWSGCLPVLRE